MLTATGIMAAARRRARRPLTLVKAKSAPAADFSDAESQRVLTRAAEAVARELGRQAAREHLATMIGKPKAS